MSDTSSSTSGTPPDQAPESAADSLHTAAFMEMVAQHTNLALIYLGAIPHPESGKTVTDLEVSRHLISQLEMLDSKTRNNLSPREQGLLKQSLMTTRLAFVRAVEHASPAPAPKPAAGPEANPEAKEPLKTEPGPGTTAAPDNPAEDRKKFVKRYSSADPE